MKFPIFSYPATYYCGTHAGSTYTEWMNFYLWNFTQTMYLTIKIMNTCALYSNIPASFVKWSTAVMIHTVRVTLGYSNQKLYKF